MLAIEGFWQRFITAVADRCRAWAISCFLRCIFAARQSSGLYGTVLAMKPAPN